MRALCCGLVLLLGGGCASSGGHNRTVPGVILGALVVGSAALAISAAVKSDSIEQKLGDDYKSREVTGSEFASRDSQGQRWNRISRAAAFVGGLSVLGLGILWEMSLSDKAESQPTKANDAPIFPVRPTGSVSLRPGQMSATAR
jgi:hypothetical protein